MNLKVYILDEVKIKTTRILLQHDVKKCYQLLLDYCMEP